MQYLNSTISPRLSQFLYCFLQHYFFFSSARVAFLPQISHFPSSVMQGCLGASPPHNPHFGISFTSFPKQASAHFRIAFYYFRRIQLDLSVAQATKLPISTPLVHK